MNIYLCHSISHSESLVELHKGIPFQLARRKSDEECWVVPQKKELYHLGPGHKPKVEEGLGCLLWLIVFLLDSDARICDSFITRRRGVWECVGSNPMRSQGGTCMCLHGPLLRMGRMHQLVNKVIAQQHVKSNNKMNHMEARNWTPPPPTHFIVPRATKLWWIRRRQKSFIAIRPPFFNRTEIARTGSIRLILNHGRRVWRGRMRIMMMMIVPAMRVFGFE